MAPTAEPEAAEALAALLRHLAAAQSQDEISQLVSRGVRGVLQADGATFVLREGDQCLYADEDAISPLWKGRRFPQSSCISGWCMANGRAASIADIYEDPRIPSDAYRPTFVRSLAMAPAGGEAALGAYWSERREPRPAELLRLQTIADATGSALQKIRAAESAGAPNPPRAERPAPPAVFWRTRLRPGSLSAYGFAIAAVALATIVRELIQATGVPGLVFFSTFFAAVVVSVLLAGRGPGLLAAVLGGFAAYYFFMPPFYGTTSWVADAINLGLYGAVCVLIVWVVDWHQRAMLRLRVEDAQHLLLAREQHHRVVNAVAVVEAIVGQSLRDQPERARTIRHRVRGALAKYVSSDRTGEPILFRDLLVAELHPYDLARFQLHGEDVVLQPQAHNLMALVIHELATNAVKYGSLSASEGKVAVSWRTSPEGAVMTWRESGGPPVVAPSRRGYGTVLMHRLVSGGGGHIAIDYPAGGLVAEIRLVSR